MTSIRCWWLWEPVLWVMCSSPETVFLEGFPIQTWWYKRIHLISFHVSHTAWESGIAWLLFICQWSRGWSLKICHWIVFFVNWIETLQCFLFFWFSLDSSCIVLTRSIPKRNAMSPNYANIQIGQNVFKMGTLQGKHVMNIKVATLHGGVISAVTKQ